MDTRACIHCLDESAGGALDGPIEARSKQRVDNGIRPTHGFGGCRLAPPLPKLRRLRSISFHAAAIAGQEDAGLVTSLVQVTGSDEAISPVVSRPRDDHDAGSRRMAERYISSDRFARIFHELHAGTALRNCQPVRFGHLARAE
jgi:hypothetical protein